MGNGTTVMSLGSEYDASRAVALKAAVEGVEGVDHAEFNYTNNKITVKFDPDSTDLKELTDLVAREKKRHTPSVIERNAREVG